MAPQQKPRRYWSLLSWLLLLGVLGFAWSQRNAIYDWTRLYSYTAPAAVAQLATDDTMTPLARHLFYVNHPDQLDKGPFNNWCPSGTEQTVVLGCYKGIEHGIYLLKVDNAELAGIEQVTAAHETLHAAYDRMSSSDRAKVDAELKDYYQNGLTDTEIKDTMASYQKTEPNDVVNEMHSVFGTEIGNLPAPLEQHYAQYFTDRAKVVGYYNTYNAAFTSRQKQVKQDDAQLTAWKQQIDQLQAQATAQQSSLESARNQLMSLKNSGQIAAYNAGVDGFNRQVVSYNSVVRQLQSLIAQYNNLVAQRNAIAVEEQTLVQAISSPTQTM